MENLLQDMQTIGAMQRHFLPRELPQPVGWQFAVHYQVGQWPSGDYYDFLPLADGRFVFLMADASDQGGPAAALAAMLRVFMHSCPLASGQEQSPFCPLHGEVVQAPHIILGNLNRIVLENALEEQSMSAFCGILNPLEGIFHFGNAGHPSPRWWQFTAWP
jgi:sigma-B regulation protein RsbU (phosphoserine phosphatase)